MVPPSESAAAAARFHRQGALAAAEPLYRQALEHRPDDADLWNGLGQVCQGLGRPDEAAACYERAERARPDDPVALNALGILLMQRGELGGAVARFERALEGRPDLVAVENNLGLALLNLGRVEEARLRFEQALRARPDLAELHNNLGLALQRLGRLEEARGRFGHAAGLRPDWADAHNNLGVALAALGRPDDALAGYERAARCNPGHFGALTNLGNASLDQGRSAEAVAAFRQALAVRPGEAAVHSNLLLALHYCSDVGLRSVLDEARLYARRHAEPLAAAATAAPPRARPLAGQRLRVGYVSADFREHPAVRFLEPVLAAHDRGRFEIVCYSDVPHPDAATARLQGYADRWRSLVGLSDAEAAGVIRADAVDLLVDLAGHTAGNRLLVFARRPAPVLVSYLGYLGTTGLPVIDGYLTDANADPPGLADGCYQEPLIRLPVCALAYDPGPAPQVDPAPPALRTGRVTFGSLNNPAKVSDEVLGLWSRLLASVPGSVLLLRTGAGRRAEGRLRDALAGHGIDPQRLLLAGRTASRAEYLELYHGIDVGLDPFPYNGLTTTCDALWMGVPVVSLAGLAGPSRQGVRVLRAAGLGRFVAETPSDYLEIARTLAGDLAGLAAIRSGLREGLSRSPLMDSARLTRDLEAAYRALWEARAGGEKEAATGNADDGSGPRDRPPNGP
jgi:predicted O-linked N-acetylglucosamine transferase (SPINDLY family)